MTRVAPGRKRYSHFARKATAREVIEFLRTKGQVGYPLSTATDSQLGYSVMAYQSADVLFGAREGDGSISFELKERARPVWPEKQIGPTGQGGVLLALYRGDTRCSTVAARSWGALEGQSTWTAVVTGT